MVLISVAKLFGARCEINNRFNPLWRDKLKSGETKTALLNAIRRANYPHTAKKLAKDSVNQYVLRQWKDYKVRVPVAERKAMMREQRNKKLEQLLREDNYYHGWWITFVYLGLPAGENKRLSFSSGYYDPASTVLHAEDKAQGHIEDPDAPAAAIRDVASKRDSNRRIQQTKK